MGHWNYRWVEVQHGDETEIGLYEVYYDDEGIPTSRSTEPTSFTGATRMEAMDSYSRAQRAMIEPILKDSDIGGWQ